MKSLRDEILLRRVMVVVKSLFIAFLYKHSLVRRRNARSSGDEEGSAEHQNLYEVAGAL